MSNDSFKVLNTEYKGCKQCSNLRLVTFGNTIIEGCACGMPNPPFCVLYKKELEKDED